MRKITRKPSPTARALQLGAVPLLVAGLLVGSGTAATATTHTAAATAHAGQDKVITLPGASSAEGIAAGAGSTFYAGDLLGGDIFRGDIRRGTAKRFIDAPEGRMAVGLKADLRRGLLFVAGGATGQAYIYNLSTGASIATLQLSDGTFINDVALVPGGAWFTDSGQAKLYFVPISKHGTPGAVRTLDLSGPAGETTGDLNGIQATPDGKNLILGHVSSGEIYTVDPGTGATALIKGVHAPNVDGLILDGRRLWAVRNNDNKIARFRLSADLSSGKLEKEITSPAFAVPTTAALFGNKLAAVNGHFDTGFPPTSPTYEVVVTKS
ncbi:SMP-30/gluconolactonase/LRE family protein [Streptomyces sp. NPDC057474]|uniref:SMP-30/gluconolactonase/LRE family protein n=1 Tax=Streptomyces sp. NPDC057474 TaxID=3346144 RepID=UPI0036843A9E